MSLGDLARRSGLSKQTLSKVEQGVGNPTVETLAALSAALDISLRRLLTEWGTPVYVKRQDDEPWEDTASWSERLLDEVYGSGYVRTLLLRLERGALGGGVVTAHANGTLHHVYVISGRVRTGPTSEPVELAMGDFARFPGDVEHRHECLTERAVLHMVTTVPQVRQFGPTTAATGLTPG